MKRLYEIETDLVLYVMAETKEKAIRIARQNIREECDNITTQDLTVIRPTALWANWENAQPYGSDDNSTVREIFEREKDDKKQMRLFK